MQTILSPMGKVQNTIAAHRMAIGKSSYMERRRGNQFLHNGIFSDTSKQQFQRKLDSRAALQKAADVSPITVQSNPALLDSSFTWNQAYQLAPHDMSRLKRSFAPVSYTHLVIMYKLSGNLILNHGGTKYGTHVFVNPAEKDWRTHKKATLGKRIYNSGNPGSFWI